MKNKYMALFMCVIICFSLVCGSVSAADNTADETTQATLEVTDADETTDAEETTKSLDEFISEKLEDVSDAGEDVMDGIYEAHGIMAKILEALENIKIFFVNFINTFLSKLPFDVPMFK